MGSGDPSGLQNRRELALLALVSSTLTRFRHHLAVVKKILRLAALAQDFACGLSLRSRPQHASSSTLTRFRHICFQSFKDQKTPLTNSAVSPARAWLATSRHDLQ